MEYVITFKSTNYAIKAEQCLLRGNLRVGVMPLPSEISAGCGICLRIAPEEIETAIRLLAKNNTNQIKLFSREINNNKSVYREVEEEYNPAAEHEISRPNI